MAETEEVLDLLADEYTQAILTTATEEHMSAQELADATDAHYSTIYRRIEQMQKHNLLDERGRLDKAGHHTAVYRTRLRDVTVLIEQDDLSIELRMREDAADRVAEMWREIRGGNQ